MEQCIYAARYRVSRDATVQSLMTQYCHSTKRTGSQLRAQRREGCLGFSFVFFEEKLDPKATFRQLGMLPEDVLSVIDRCAALP